MKRMRRCLGLVLLLALTVCCVGGALAEKKVELSDELPTMLGQTTISWDVKEASDSRYVVTYKVLDNGTAKQSTIEAGRTYANSLSTGGLLPGKNYEIAVKDADGNVLDQKAYRMDAVETYSDGTLKNTSIKVYVKPSLRETGKDPKKISTGLKAKDIMSGWENGKYYGVHYQMSMPRNTKERSIFITLAFESPDGFLYVDKTTFATVEASSRNSWQNLYWNIAAEDFFKELYKMNGNIPAGKYAAHLYWDGMWVNTTNFNVK